MLSRIGSAITQYSSSSSHEFACIILTNAYIIIRIVYIAGWGKLEGSQPSMDRTQIVWQKPTSGTQLSTNNTTINVSILDR
jgi:hypothetical protein